MNDQATIDQSQENYSTNSLECQEEKKNFAEKILSIVNTYVVDDITIDEELIKKNMYEYNINNVVRFLLECLYVNPKHQLMVYAVSWINDTDYYYSENTFTTKKMFQEIFKVEMYQYTEMYYYAINVWDIYRESDYNKLSKTGIPGLITNHAKYLKRTNGMLPIPGIFFSSDEVERKVFIPYATNTILSNKIREHSSILNRYSRNTTPIILNQNKNTEIVSIQDTSSPFVATIPDLFRNKQIGQDAKLETNTYFINPNMAKILEGKVVTMDMMMEIFGIKPDNMKAKLLKIKEKDLHIVLIGLGGVMSNFCYFVNELAKEFNISYIFDLIKLFEDDDLELSNIFRIPLDYLTPIFRNRNADRLYYYRYELNDTMSNNKGYMLYNCHNLYNNYIFSEEKLTKQHLFRSDFYGYDYILGAPDIRTREILFESNYKFLCTLHHNNDLYIYRNPEMTNTDLMVETYGQIRLDYFFLNMFRMTIELLDIMAEGKEYPKDTLILHYAADKELDTYRKNLQKSKYSFILN